MSVNRDKVSAVALFTFEFIAFVIFVPLCAVLGIVIAPVFLIAWITDADWAENLDDYQGPFPFDLDLAVVAGLVGFAGYLFAGAALVLTWVFA